MMTLHIWFPETRHKRFLDESFELQVERCDYFQNYQRQADDTSIVNMASGDAETRDMDNSNSESEHDSDEDLAVLELIDASSSDDDEDVKEDVRRHSDRRNRSLPESDRANASSRVDRPLSELVVRR